MSPGWANEEAADPQRKRRDIASKVGFMMDWRLKWWSGWDPRAGPTRRSRFGVINNLLGHDVLRGLQRHRPEQPRFLQRRALAIEPPGGERLPAGGARFAF